MEKDVFLYSNGVKLPGKVSIPEKKNNEGKYPVAVFSHGYGASKNEFGDFIVLSDILNDMGIATFRFDYRGCGFSFYQPGRMLCRDEWKEDLKNAVSFISHYTGIDSEKICLIGESMGASVAVLSASEDLRVKCIIALSTIADGYEWVRLNWIRNKSAEGFESFLEEIKEDQEREATYGQSNFLKMSDALAYEDRYLDLIEEIRQSFDSRDFTYYVQYASIASILSMKPIEVIEKVAPRPLLLLAGEKDGIVPWKMNSQKLYDSAGEIKKLIVYKEGDHGLLAEPTRQGAISEITGWLENYLVNS